jgi:hypothetical protein
MKWLLRIALVVLFSLPFSGLLFAAEEADDVAIITGRVTDDDNYPLSAISVILIDPDSPDERTTAAATDASGFFTVSQVISATWIIRFEPPSEYYSDYLPEYYNDTYDIAAAERITAEVGTVTPNINASLAYAGQLSGQVTAEDTGAPLENVLVTVYHASNDAYTYDFTDSDGAFAVTLEPGRRYKVHFDPTIASGYALEVYNDKTRLSEAEIIRMPLDRDVRLNIALAKGGAISGMVFSSWQGKPLEYPTATAFDENGEQIQTGTRNNDEYSDTSELGPPGYYIVGNLPPGRYQLEFSAWMHGPSTRSRFIDVVAGETVEKIDGTAIISPHVVSLATSPAIPNMIIASFAHDPVPVFTLDGGRSWQMVPSTTWIRDASPYAFPDRTFYQPVHVTAGITLRGAPGEGVRILVGASYSSLQPVPLRAGLYRSGDNGQSWANSMVDPPFDFGPCGAAEYLSFVTTPIAPSDLYVFLNCNGGLSRLLVSHNSGVTWNDVTTVDGRSLVLHYRARVIPSPYVADEVYLFDGSTQWHKSIDGGFNWENIEMPMEFFVFDPNQPTHLSGWSTAVDPDYTRKGKRSTDGGATWEDWVQQPCPPYFFEQDLQLIAHPTASNVVFLRCVNSATNGIYRSDSSGDFWKRLTPQTGQAIFADYSYGEPGRILWAKDDGLWASTDLGETWQMLWRNYQLTDTFLYLPAVATDR